MTRPLTRLAALALGAAAFTFLPLGQIAGVSLGGADVALAKGGNGGGNGGNGGGGGGGGGGGHGGGSGGGRGSSGEHGGGSAKGSHGGSKKSAGVSGETGGKGHRKGKTVEQASLETEVEGEVEDGAGGKAKNLHAKLGGLNSLKRNINGIMKSADPKMEGIRSFLTAYAAYETAEVAEAAAEADLTEAEKALSDALAGYPDGTTVADLEAQRAALLGSVPEGEAVPPDLQDQIDALDADIAAAGAAQTAYEQAQADYAAAVGATDAAGALVTDETLTQALLDGANPNKVAAYGGPEGYVDAEMLDWAKTTLGVTTYEAPTEPEAPAPAAP